MGGAGALRHRRLFRLRSSRRGRGGLRRTGPVHQGARTACSRSGSSASADARPVSDRLWAPASAGRPRPRAQDPGGRPVADRRAAGHCPGQENSARRDLTFIEMASFAVLLENRGFGRDNHHGALTVDKTELSRLISCRRALPDDLVLAIVPAPKAGRRRWMEMAERLQGADASASWIALKADPAFRKLESRSAVPAHVRRAFGQAAAQGAGLDRGTAAKDSRASTTRGDCCASASTRPSTPISPPSWSIACRPCCAPVGKAVRPTDPWGALRLKRMPVQRRKRVEAKIPGADPMRSARQCSGCVAGGSGAGEAF